MDVMEIVSQARDAMTVRRVFGEPYERDGVTIIPAVRLFGGAGGGSGGAEGSPESGAGTGFGLVARPVGAFVIKDGQVTWVPALDMTRVAMAAGVVSVAAILTFRSMRLGRQRTKRKLAKYRT